MTKHYKVVVTGYSGFIGRNLCATLSECGNVQIVKISRYELMQLDTRADISLNLLNRVENADAFINCAGHAGGALKVLTGKKISFIESNIFLPTKTYFLASRANIKKFVHISTAKVYGETSPPSRCYSVSSSVNPTTVYSRSKLIGENRLIRQARHSKTNLYILRPPIVSGRHNRILDFFVNLFNWARFPLPVSDKNQRSYITIESLSKRIYEIIEENKNINLSNALILNVKDGEVTSRQLLGLKYSSSINGEAFFCWIGKLFKLINIAFPVIEFYNKFYADFVICE